MLEVIVLELTRSITKFITNIKNVKENGTRRVQEIGIQSSYNYCTNDGIQIKRAEGKKQLLVSLDLAIRGI